MKAWFDADGKIAVVLDPEDKAEKILWERCMQSTKRPTVRWHKMGTSATANKYNPDVRRDSWFRVDFRVGG